MNLEQLKSHVLRSPEMEAIPDTKWQTCLFESHLKFMLIVYDAEWKIINSISRD